jgi:hypothetical protein
MDRWFKVSTNVDGPKLRALVNEIGCAKGMARGILMAIWSWAAEGNADFDGLILNAGIKEISEVLVNELDEGMSPVEIVYALIRTRWIDEIDGLYYIHDWTEHQEYFIDFMRKREKDAERKRNERAKKKAQSERSAPAAKQEQKTDAPKEDIINLFPAETPEPPKAKPVKQERTPGFEAFYAAYPRKLEPGLAYKKYMARIKDGYSDDQLLEAAQNYAAECRRARTEDKYIKHPKTFLSDSLPFLDYLPKKKEPKPEEQVPNFSNPFAEYREG